MTEEFEIDDDVRPPIDAPPCSRCGHPADWHRLDDSTNVSPTDPAAEFRCIGYDCTADRVSMTPCDVDCPAYVEDGVLAESGTAEAFARARESIRSMHNARSNDGDD